MNDVNVDRHWPGHTEHPAMLHKSTVCIFMFISYVPLTSTIKKRIYKEILLFLLSKLYISISTYFVNIVLIDDHFIGLSSFRKWHHFGGKSTTQTPVSSNGLRVRFACFGVLVGCVTKHFILFDWITQISLIIINISKDQDKVEVFSPFCRS